MKLKMKFNVIAAGALALATASSAFAIQTGISGNGSVLAVAYDKDAKATFVFDTGLFYNDIAGNPTANLSFNFGSSANWQSFAALPNTDEIYWTVFANNSVNATANLKILTTAAAGTTNTTGGNSLNTGFTSATTGPNPWETAINSVLDTATSTSFTTVAVNGTPYDYGSQVDSGAQGTAFNGNIKFETTAALGTAQSFYALSKASSGTRISVNGVGINATNPAGADQTGQWLLTSAGALSYTASSVVTSVPEPESYALSLVGLLSMGFVAWRRRSA